MLFVLPVLKSGITVFGLKIRIFSLKFIFVDLSQLFKNFQGCITVYLSKIKQGGFCARYIFESSLSQNVSCAIIHRAQAHIEQTRLRDALLLIVSVAHSLATTML